MKNKEKYDLRDISYNLELNNGGYDFVVYYTSKEIYREFFGGDISICSAFTKWLEEECNPEILTDKEKAYLSAVIKPFREEVKCINKTYNDIVNHITYIRIDFLNKDFISLPLFKREAMYKGMECDKEYTLEELGL